MYTKHGQGYALHEDKYYKGEMTLETACGLHSKSEGTNRFMTFRIIGCKQLDTGKGTIENVIHLSLDDAINFANWITEEVESFKEQTQSLR